MTNHEEKTWPQEAAYEEEKLTFAETERLLPPAVEFMGQTGWDQVSKVLAIALATHQVVNEQAHRIHKLARALLHLKHQKELPEE